MNHVLIHSNKADVFFNEVSKKLNEGFFMKSDIYTIIDNYGVKWFCAILEKESWKRKSYKKEDFESKTDFQ